MRRLLKRVGFCFLLAALVWVGSLIADRQLLHKQLIRFHVVANSDSKQDQSVKLQVRDAVMESLQNAMSSLTDIGEARTYLQRNLPKIQAVANEALAAAGCDYEAAVSLCEEVFDTRVYDTFSLPAGVYEALRITLGEGKGKNWWCVVFPSFCVGGVAETFEDVAAGAGFPDSLGCALTGEYEIRFFLLDAMGRIENILFAE